MKFLIAEVLIVIAIAVSFIFLFRRKLSKKSLVISTGLIVIFGAIAGNVINLISVPTEPVTITALDEKNEKSTQTQVALTAIIVDEKEYELKNASEGKWFWRGDDYYWRPDSDNRRPDGLTRTIVIDVPIGNHRELVFDSWTNRGIVEISSGEATQMIDTYGKSSIPVVLEKTKSYKVIVFKLFKLFIFAVAIFGLVALTILTKKKYETNPVKAKLLLSRHWDKMVYAGVSLAFFAFVFVNGKNGSLWGDEIWSLGWYYDNNHTFSSGFWHFYVMKLWLRIAPYGQEFLLIIPELLCVVSIYISGLIGSRIRGKRFGIILSLLMATSSTIIYQCAFEIRNYAWLLSASVSAFYVMILRNEMVTVKPIKYSFIYSAVIVLLFDSHAYGIPVGAILLGCDFLAIIFKKLDKKCFVEFILPILYVIYFFAFVTSDLPLSGTSFGAAPTANNVVDILRWLCNYNDIEFIFLLVGTSSVAVMLISALLRK